VLTTQTVHRVDRSRYADARGNQRSGAQVTYGGSKQLEVVL